MSSASRTGSILVAGGTGLIGKRLARQLLDRGDSVTILTRRTELAALMPELTGATLISGDPTQPGSWSDRISDHRAIINLAGHPIFAGKGVLGLFRLRWTPKSKQQIRISRVESAQTIANAIMRAATRPSVWIQASAIGYYGSRGDEILDETSSPGSDFLANVCQEWEAPTRDVSETVRVVIPRIGIVLERHEGALGLLEPLIRKVPGGAAPIGGGKSALWPGNGRQWMSWIHLEDVVRLMIYALDHSEISGPLNATAPTPVTNREFTRALARFLNRWSLPLGPPEWVLRMILGEAAATFVEGQRVLPEKAKAGGFSFQFPDLERAFSAIFMKNSQKRQE